MERQPDEKRSDKAKRVQAADKVKSSKREHAHYPHDQMSTAPLDNIKYFPTQMTPFYVPPPNQI